MTGDLTPVRMAVSLKCYEKQYEVPPKVKSRLPYGPAIPLLAVDPKELKSASGGETVC